MTTRAKGANKPITTLTSADPNQIKNEELEKVISEQDDNIAYIETEIERLKEQINKDIKEYNTERFMTENEAYSLQSERKIQQKQS